MEAREIGIGRADLASMLDRQRREVRVRGDVARRPQRLHEPAQNREVALGRVEDESTRLGDPALDHGEGLGWGERAREELGAGRQPHERK